MSKSQLEAATAGEEIGQDRKYREKLMLTDVGKID